MNNVNWKAIGLGALDIILLLILASLLAGFVAHGNWIAAQICILGTLLLLTLAMWQLRRMLLGGGARDAEKKTSDRGLATIVKLLQFTACGVVAIIIYAIQHDHWTSAAVARVAGVGLLTAGAALAAGAVLGFLFGVPRTHSAPATGGATSSASGAVATATATSTEPQFGANTNLEQISDWLTKTIVGVGLVELAKLPHRIDGLAWYVAAGMGSAGPDAKAVALVIMVYFVSAGFLISYLWTRMELTRAFNESALSKRITDLERQSDIDAAAIAGVDRWLNHRPANQQEQEKARADMMTAIRSSSSVTKARVFVSADQYVRTNTASLVPADITSASDIALPIFQALVEADPEKIFHRNRSQYAFCLMTKTGPDFQNALTNLSDAIDVRDRSREPGWIEYEFGRAVCRMKLDPNARAKADVRALINADLTKAATLAADKRRRIDPDGAAAQWAANP